jgi:beta-phosphoglucomutase
MNNKNQYSQLRGAIFDLDGVLVDTAKYHYLAWKRLAGELGFLFTEQDNKALKGVSRMASLDILLQVGGLSFDKEKKEKLAAKKNAWYVEYLQQLTENDVLNHVIDTLRRLRQSGIRLAIGSASKNTPLILEKTKLAPYFDAVIDGNCTSKAKPDPEVFLLGAEKLGLKGEDCMVFEDSEAGIEAANAGGMLSIYLGTPSPSVKADIILSDLGELWETGIL